MERRSARLSESRTDRNGDTNDTLFHHSVLACRGGTRPVASLSLEILSLFYLRRASDLRDVHRWIDPVPGIPILAIGSIFVVLFSGIYLAMRMAAFDMAWPKVAIVALLLILPFGRVNWQAYARHPPQLRRGAKMKPELLRRLQDPFLKVFARHSTRRLLWHCTAHGGEAGIVAIARIVVCSVVLGLFLPLLAWRQTGPLPTRGELQGWMKVNSPYLNESPYLKEKMDTWKSF